MGSDPKRNRGQTPFNLTLFHSMPRRCARGDSDQDDVVLLLGVLVFHL